MNWHINKFIAVVNEIGNVLKLEMGGEGSTPVSLGGKDAWSVATKMFPKGNM